jgi:hypothetical protein
VTKKLQVSFPGKSRVVAPTPPKVEAVEPTQEDDFEPLIQRLERLSLSRVSRPVYEDGTPMDPQLPPDLTRLTDDALGSLYTEFCAMAQWVGFQHSVSSVARARLEIAAKRARSRVYLMQSGNREEKAALTDVNPEVRSTEDQLLLAQNLEMLAFPVLNSYLIGKEATSREMTRRQGTDWNRGGMGNSSIPRPQASFGGKGGRPSGNGGGYRGTR